MSEPIYTLPPNEMIPELMMLACQLAEDRDWGHTPLELVEAQALADGTGIKVAVLDTGCDLTHPDLKDQIAGSKDFTGSGSGPSDVQGHGTHCAGIILAATNGQGLIGVAPKARLYNGKVLGDNGSGSESGIVNGIRWAISQGVDVISMSLGSSSPSNSIRGAVQEAVNAGIIVVAAAGNEGPNEGTVGYPGGFDECICVAAVDSSLQAANFSSRGPANDVAAPGVSILSTYPGGRYSRLSGTSMATPYVAGCVAIFLDYLKRQGKPKPNYRDILSLLSSTTKDLGNQGKDTSYGWGLIQPLAMFKSVTPTPPPPPTPTLVPGFTGAIRYTYVNGVISDISLFKPKP